MRAVALDQVVDQVVDVVDVPRPRRRGVCLECGGCGEVVRHLEDGDQVSECRDCWGLGSRLVDVLDVVLWSRRPGDGPDDQDQDHAGGLCPRPAVIW